MYMNIRVQWTVHKMGGIIKNNMTIIKYLIELVHITLLHTITICAE